MIYQIFCLLCLTAATAVAKPNVVIFLTDDQGWGDLSVNGNTNLHTPNIDSLAKDGATFENFYVCPVCAPTRAEFLTGRYHPRTGVSGVSKGEGRLNVDETTIADVFKQAGYSTGAFGKWHNGTQWPYHPNARGFDEYYGFTSGHWGNYFSPPLDHNGKYVKGNGFVVDDFTDHALEFIDQNKDKPFFCYIPYNTPHSPMMVEDEFYEKFADMDPAMKSREGEKEDIMMTRAALAMCENIDWNVGRVLEKLNSLDLTEDTIVIYFSDNGPNSYRWNGGMKGKKGNSDEGGVRSPFFIKWPKRIPAGINQKTVAAGLDLLPTLVSMAEIEWSSEKLIDGRDFSSVCYDEKAKLPDRLLFSQWQKRLSVRNDQFRLDDKGNLFDMQNDRGQERDVSKLNPEIAKQMREAAKAHRSEMMDLKKKWANRPFTVGYSEMTPLPARDAVAHGSVVRSAKPPNNSFFENWTGTDGYLTWDVEVGKQGNYEVTLYHTCRSEDVGAEIRLKFEGETSSSTEVIEIVEAYDPPLDDKSKERVTESHYYTKDFKPVSLGVIELPKGKGQLKLVAEKIVGEEAVDVYSIILRLQE